MWALRKYTQKPGHHRLPHQVPAGTPGWGSRVQGLYFPSARGLLGPGLGSPETGGRGATLYSEDQGLGLALGSPSTRPPQLPGPRQLGRILVETFALAHGVEARAQLGQATHPALSLFRRGRRQVQVLAAALEGDGEAARRREGAPEAPQALGLVALTDRLDVLHED